MPPLRVNKEREVDMRSTIERQLAALEHLSPAQLRVKYREVFGEDSRTGNKGFLLKRVAWRMQSLAEGGLSERARQRARELACDADIRTTIPKAKPVSGSSSNIPMKLPEPQDRRLPIPGTILTREWRGEKLQVTVLPKGFEYRGTVYRSLSAVAKAITGSHWNGYGFFNLLQEAQ
jgi:hypothetical protein